MHDHVCLITGAGSGVGRAVAVEMAGLGASIGLVGRTSETLEESAELVKAAGGKAVMVTADVGVEVQTEAAVRRIATEYRRVDSLVMCAGIGIFGPVERYQTSDWDSTIRTNLTGAFLASRAAIPHLRSAGQGSIVAISSGAGKQGYANLAAYSASKFGLMGLMQALAEELGPSGVRVSTVVPGSILTEFGGTSLDEKRQRSKEGRRYLAPSAVARAVVYLLQSPPGAWTQELNLWPS
ncbi:SDR family NAD(P)-dependent oxidoreductase [soil metagenome]